MTPKLITALDYSSFDDVKTIVDKLSTTVVYYKVGLELFISQGAGVIEYLKKADKKVFLDLKFHDIPNTVSSALKAVISHGVDMVNVHTQGGYEMMKSATEAVRNESSKQGLKAPMLIGVTLLTSLDLDHIKRFAINMPSAEEYVLMLAREAKFAGLDGVVSSAKEVKAVKELCGREFITVTPGIRLADDSKGDQLRVVTPKDAKLIGSDYIVVGRSITSAKDPLAAANKVLDELK